MIISVTARSSFGGTVFAIAQTAVNPPATAARVPVAIVSLCSCPGSRRCVCRSMKPGATTRPAASKTGTLDLILLSTRDTRPSSMRTSSLASSSWLGSITRPLVMSRFMVIEAWTTAFGSLPSWSLRRVRPTQQVQHGHPHRHPVRHLLEDDRPLRVIGNLGCDLYAPVHGAGVHDDDVLLRPAHSLARGAKGVVVLPPRGGGELAPPLELDAKHHDDVRPADGLIQGGHGPHT